MDADSCKRKTIYIYKNFQRSFIFWFCLAVFGAMLATSVILLLLFRLWAQGNVPEFFPWLLGINAVVLLVLVGLTFVVALLTSHRIGGPLYRIQGALQNIGQGRLDQDIRLREGDQLKDFAVQVNHMTSSLRQRIKSIGRAAAEVEQMCQASSADPQLVECIAKLERLVEKSFVTGQSQA